MSRPINVSLPLDDGFLRRECPHCERAFKWHHGSTDDRPDDFTDPTVYHCPYCGRAAATDAWFTREQIRYMTELAGHEMGDEIERRLKEAVRPIGKSGFIKMDVEYRPGPRPRSLSEPDDMTRVAPPCHPFEPLKVLDDWDGLLHCIVCGERFNPD